MKNITIFVTLALLLFFSNGYSQYLDNYAGNFNGTSSYGAVPDIPALNPTGAITLEAWVYPAVLNASTMAVIGKNYQTSYFLGVQTSGRVVFYPKGGASFRSRVNSVIPVNQWTHIAGTFDGITTIIYINGVADTSSTAFTGGIGVNTDSLFIGADRVGSTPSLFFNGRIDNVRIWGIARSAGMIFDNRLVPLEVYRPTGNYDNLRASFQLDAGINSFSGSAIHSGFERNLTFIDYRNKPVNHMDYNNNLVLNGSTDHFTIVNHEAFNVTTAITLEAWIRRDTTGTQPNDMYILNKSGSTDRFNYALWLFTGTGTLKFKINDPGGPSGIISPTPIITAQWTHVAATYNSVTGNAKLYINGVNVNSTIFTGSPLVQNNPDNLYIGGIGASSLAANKFKGQIDGVRIWSVERTADQIKENMYKYIASAAFLTHFNFDKYTNAIYSGISRIYTTNFFAGLAHISSSHLNNNKELTSPMLSDAPGGYYANYTRNDKSFFVPDGNMTGIKDSLQVSAGSTIGDLKAYVLLSHTFVADMTITLISPSGTSVNLFNRRGFNGNDIMTIFSDAADSVASLGTQVSEPGITPPFSPHIKPEQSLSAFNGENQLGWWKMKFVDVQGADFGYVHSWGINVTTVTAITNNLDVFPDSFELKQNYPNPFNSSTLIKFYIPISSNIELKIYDMLGKEIASLVNQKLNKGYYEVNFNAGNLSSGVYYYGLIENGNDIVSKKLILIK